MDELLTTRQVAAELQVSESSVKRWCDQGVIRTLKTAGGHRRIERAMLEEFLAVTAGRGVSLPEKIERSQTAAIRDGSEAYSVPSREELLTRFQQALVAGDEVLARQLVRLWSQRYQGIAQLGDQLIAGAMERIGRLWECGRAEVFEERRSCEICTHLLTELRAQVSDPPANAPNAIGGTIQGDYYVLANQLVELVLRDAGWNASNLGGNLPLDSILVAVRRHKPRLLWLSISFIEDSDTFVAAYNQFYTKLPPGIAVAVGGRALTDQIRPRIGYTAHCDNLEQLSALARAIAGKS